MNSNWLVVLLVASAAGALWLLVERGRELFCLSWRGGEMRLVRGRVPVSLRHDFADALTHLKAERATIWVRRDEAGARLTASGVDEFGEQRLRNILQVYPTSRLAAAPVPAHNALWRLLGVGALVWLFGHRDD